MGIPEGEKSKKKVLVPVRQVRGGHGAAAERGAGRARRRDGRDRAAARVARRRAERVAGMLVMAY